ncbi:PEGA domain-containing protein [Sorangium cellulosum]|uniref:PEGA domain-containing protein n=1 Tax=Sorangium cellulosum TaxID=56 RepID=UPI0005D2D088|nr:PEGA domain-containing protein [Sorangium cellulosum]
MAGWILALGLLGAETRAEPADDTAKFDIYTGEPLARAHSDDEAPARAHSDDKAPARAHFERGVARFDRQEYREALEEFRKSLEHKRTRNAMGYVASCLKQLGQYDDALEQYEAMRSEYPELPPRTEATVAADMAELAGLVGTLVLRGDVPAGASLFIDDRFRGRLPLDKPLRLSVGSRAVRVEKEGFAPIATTVEVKAGRENVAELVATSRKGRLRVSERHNWPLEIEIDGKATGAVTPWEGLLDPGEHTVRLRGFLDEEALLSCDVPGAMPGGKWAAARQGAKMESGVKTVNVRLYDVAEVVLGAEDQDASLKIESAPTGARLWIDGKEVGQTPWEGRLPLGEHAIGVRADGYLYARQEVTLERRKQREVTVALDRVPGFWTAEFWTARTVGATAGYGTGVLGLGVFAVSGVLALNTSADLKQACPGGLCPRDRAAQKERAHALGVTALAGLIVGGAGAVAGTVVLVAARPEREEKRVTSAGTAWEVGVGPFGLSLGGSF